jgi:diguanylate cyclase (GGDEF)-like protein
MHHTREVTGSGQQGRARRLGRSAPRSHADPVEASALSFGVRLIVTFAVSVALAGAGGYLLLDRQLAHAHSAAGAAGEARLIFATSWLLALFAGGAVFYLAGGRRLVRDHRTVLHCATRDRLTDLPNLRSFQADLPDGVASATRHGEPLALVALEVDHLDLINDRHGRGEGDATLRVVAGVLRSSRPSDRPYRIGGDDFALLLAHTDFAGVRALARRLRRDFAEAGVEVSIGTSVLRAGLHHEMLRAEAWAALDEVRRAGGGRAVHFEEIRERLRASGPDPGSGMPAPGGARLGAAGSR